MEREKIVPKNGMGNGEWGRRKAEWTVIPSNTIYYHQPNAMKASGRVSYFAPHT